jgi:outer membrane protein OmpU
LKFEGKTMKKVLFATTALVATAGIAAADVVVTGSADMGIAGASNNWGGAATAPQAGYDGTTTFMQSIDVDFTMSGETDNGLSFGASIDLDDAGGTANVAGDFADYTVFISGNFGTLTMGDTDGAFDWALQEVNLGSPGSIADDETLHAGYNGNAGLDGFSEFDGQVLRYDYTIGDFGVALSAEIGDENESEDAILGIGFRYGFDFAGGTFGVGLGYQTVEDAVSDTVAGDGTPVVVATPGDQGRDIIGVSLHAVLDNGLSAAINYSDINGTGTLAAQDGTHMAIGASYTFDAFTVHANYGEYDWDAGSGVADAEGYGFAAGYDLGGGASLLLGYGHSDITAQNGSTTTLGDYNSWSFGISMSF